MKKRLNRSRNETVDLESEIGDSRFRDEIAIRTAARKFSDFGLGDLDTFQMEIIAKKAYKFADLMLKQRNNSLTENTDESD